MKFQGREVLGLSRRELDSVRGRHVAFVFQDPLTALTPHLTIETQMGEVLAHHFHVKGEEARASGDRVAGARAHSGGGAAAQRSIRTSCPAACASA